MTAYMDAWISFQSRRSSGKDEFWKAKRAAKQAKREALQEEVNVARNEKRGRKQASATSFYMCCPAGTCLSHTFLSHDCPTHVMMARPAPLRHSASIS